MLFNHQRCRTTLWMFLFFSCYIHLASAHISPKVVKAPLQSTSTVLRVGVIEDPPFAFVRNRKFTGISIELWEEVAQMNRWKYHFIPLGEHVDTGLKMLVNGQLDVLVGPISTFSERLQWVDFTRPYFINKIGIVLKKKSRDWVELIKYYTHFKFVQIFFSVFVFFVLISHFFWYVERRVNNRISLIYLTGLIDTMWYIMFNFLRGGNIPKPVTAWGRVYILLWLLVLFVATITITASITSEFTLSKIYTMSDYHSLEYITNKRLAAVQGRISMNLARKYSHYAVEMDDLDQAFKSLIEGKVDAVIEDYYIAEAILKQPRYRALFMSALSIQYDELTFAVPKNSPFLKKIDISITHLQDIGETMIICRSFIQEDQSNFCLL